MAIRLPLLGALGDVAVLIILGKHLHEGIVLERGWMHGALTLLRVCGECRRVVEAFQIVARVDADVFHRCALGGAAIGGVDDDDRGESFH